MDLSGLSIADPSPSESDQGTFGAASPLSPRLRDKLNKLAKWRIDNSLIEFPEDAPEFEGGHATVSRGLLTPASATGAHLNKPQNFEGGPSPPDGSIKKKVIAVKKLKTENGETLERVLELALRETEFLVGLASPYIIKLDGFVEDLPNNRIWLIFPWEEYGNLKDFVAAQDWEIPERISLIDGVARGVEYLHSRSPPIYHGDLKSNRKNTKLDEARPYFLFKISYAAAIMNFAGHSYQPRVLKTRPSFYAVCKLESRGYCHGLG